MVESLDWTRPLPPNGVRVLLELADSLDVSPAVVLKNVGLRPIDLVNDHALVTGHQEVAALRNLQAAVPRMEHLGLLAGQLQPITALGSLGFAYITSPHLLASVELNRRFLPLTWSMCAFDVYQEEGDVVFEFEPGALPEDVAQFYLQRDTAAAVHLGRQNGDLRLVRSTFAWSRPRSPEAMAAYLELFGEAPTFDATGATLRTLAAPLLQPQSLASPSAHERFVAEAAEDLRVYMSLSGMRGRVRQKIQESLESGPSLEGIAAELLVSGRTLRRQLAMEGTAFRDILEEVRRDRAATLLAKPDLGIGQIASKLGYENAPAFNVAFRRWYGASPSEYRQENA